MKAVSAITLDQLTSKLEALKAKMSSGTLKHGEYDQRLARLIQELRERKIDAERPAIQEKLQELLDNQVITPSVREHIVKRLGL